MLRFEQLTKYEACRLIGRRVLELQLNSPPCVPMRPGMSLFDLAHEELKTGKLDFTLYQIWPGDVRKEWSQRSPSAKRARLLS